MTSTIRPGMGRGIRATGRRRRRCRPRSGRSGWRCRGIGPARSPRRWCRRGDGASVASDVIISLYAGGMPPRDIAAHLQRVYSTEVSADTVSRVTDAVLEEVKAWQCRPLDEVYPIVYIDALMVKVRDGNTVRNKAAHLVVG